MPKLRVLFITLEYSAATFSGNGVCAQSQVRALSQHGHDVFVISGRPAECKDQPKPQGATRFHEVPLSSWGRLDRQSPWQEFAAACTRLGAQVADFNPQIVWGIDWTSLQPYYEVAGRLHPDEELSSLPYIYMNYRVFCRSVKRQSESEEEREFLREKEAEAVTTAALTAALGRSDATYIYEHLMPNVPLPDRAFPKVILPALRSDLADIALPNDILTHARSEPVRQALSRDSSIRDAVAQISLAAPADSKADSLRKMTEAITADEPVSAPSSCEAASENAARQAADEANSMQAADPEAHLPGAARGRRRRYLTCCVRLSPEKEPLRFVDLVEHLAQLGALEQSQVTPVLCGSATSPFANTVRKRLLSVCPQSIIMSQFLGPAQLAELYSNTCLNFHPCAYDAFGMTIVEAASQGAPTLVDEAKDVGATDLLQPELSEVLTADYGMPKADLAKHVAQLLADETQLMTVGSLAAIKARAWTEAALGTAMQDIIASVVPSASHG